MKNFISVWKDFKKMKILEHFRKLGKIYNCENWTSTFYDDIDESLLKWLYIQVLPFLALNKNLPLNARYMKENEFVLSMRIWLKFAYREKKRQNFGKRYVYHWKKCEDWVTELMICIELLWNHWYPVRRAGWVTLYFPL